MALSISAVIPTRGDVDLSRIVENLRRFPEVREIIFEIGDTTLNRYRGAGKALHEIIYTQDDDYVTDLRPIVDAYRPGMIVNAMTESHQAGYLEDETLLGFGSIFDKALLSVLDGWEEDALFLREADRVFATLNRHFTVFPKIEVMPWAHNFNRLCFQPEHGSSHVAIRKRINAHRSN